MCGQLSKTSAKDVKMPENLGDETKQIVYCYWPHYFITVLFLYANGSVIHPLCFTEKKNIEFLYVWI